MTHLLTVGSPVGALTITEEAGAIAAIGWGGARHQDRTALLAEAERQLIAYFAGKLRHFDLPLAPQGSRFDLVVWRAMQQIPYGETRSYGELAHAVGSAPRAVGGACGRNPIPIVVPCHRVLSRAGLGGYSGAGGLATKTALLALEGAAAGVGGRAAVAA
ncbi:MAG TPA: methylated-DNA--[protein]-cysteine S-methyltransferase [Stellaceae bacterium]|nr:methylated-DNA--[protein]-cysteine S-methyltransferase [Stellaceae bacterium]